MTILNNQLVAGTDVRDIRIWLNSVEQRVRAMESKARPNAGKRGESGNNGGVVIGIAQILSDGTADIYRGINDSRKIAEGVTVVSTETTPSEGEYMLAMLFRGTWEVWSFHSLDTGAVVVEIENNSGDIPPASYNDYQMFSGYVYAEGLENTGEATGKIIVPNYPDLVNDYSGSGGIYDSGADYLDSSGLAGPHVAHRCVYGGDVYYEVDWHSSFGPAWHPDADYFSSGGTFASHLRVMQYRRPADSPALFEELIYPVNPAESFYLLIWNIDHRLEVIDATNFLLAGAGISIMQGTGGITISADVTTADLHDHIGGDGISVSGTSTITITNTDRGSVAVTSHESVHDHALLHAHTESGGGVSLWNDIDNIELRTLTGETGQIDLTVVSGAVNIAIASAVMDLIHQHTAGDGISIAGAGDITITNADRGSTAVGAHETTYDHALLHAHDDASGTGVSIWNTVDHINTRTLRQVIGETVISASAGEITIGLSPTWINGLSTAPFDSVADWLPFFDNSAGGHRKLQLQADNGVQINSQTGSIQMRLDVSSLTEATPDWENDWLAFYDASAGAHRKATPNNLHRNPITPTTPTTIGAAAEGNETADSTTGTSESTGMEVYVLSRIGYFHAGSQTLYQYVRKMTIDAQGHVVGIGAETRITVDTPEACS